MILDVSKPKTVSLLEQQIGNLYVTAKEYPQIQCEEKHHFGPNIYIKEVTMPAGSLIIGKHHRMEHLCNMMSGRMIVVDSDGNRSELIAPMTFMAKPGRKIAYIIETVRFQNIFSTDETDVEKLEHMLVEDTPVLLTQGE